MWGLNGFSSISASCAASRTDCPPAGKLRAILHAASTDRQCPTPRQPYQGRHPALVNDGADSLHVVGFPYNEWWRFSGNEAADTAAAQVLYGAYQGVFTSVKPLAINRRICRSPSSIFSVSPSGASRRGCSPEPEYRRGFGPLLAVADPDLSLMHDPVECGELPLSGT